MDLPSVPMLDQLTLQQGDALLLVDIQNDFLSGGALATQNGERVIPGVNHMISKAIEANLPIVLTQDWHPGDHLSFASQHPGKQPFDAYQAEGLGPVLWPDHCVQDSFGSEFAETLNTKDANAIIRKGYNRKIDSYSGFLENDHKTETGLAGYLNDKGVKRLLIGGLAYDYCVYFTSIDGAMKGFEVVIFPDLTQPVGAPEGSVDRASEDLKEKGVQFISSAQVEASVR
jgi:nicotinamidase/pyrazinamidase